MKRAMLRGLKATPLTSYGAVSRVSTCQTRKGEAAELCIFSISLSPATCAAQVCGRDVTCPEAQRLGSFVNPKRCASCFL